MTNPGFGNNLIKELLVSQLKPEFIVTESPYHIKYKNRISYPLKKIIKYLKFFRNRGEYQKKYQPYFMGKKYGIPIIPSDKADSKFLEAKIKEAEIDYIFTFIFKVLKPHIYLAPKIGSINFHPSELPFNRGATPWNWMIRQEVRNTKISFHQISKGIDTGDILRQFDVPVPPCINSSILRELLFNLGSLFYIKLIYELKYGTLAESKENKISEGSYEPPFNKTDTVISMNHTFNEMISIINASRDSFYNAIFEKNNTKHSIVNYIELPLSNSLNKNNPEIDIDGNLLVKTIDNKYILLITNKTKIK